MTNVNANLVMSISRHTASICLCLMTLDFTFERRLELQRAETAEEGEKIAYRSWLEKIAQK